MAEKKETEAQRIIREAVEKKNNGGSKPITVKTPSTQTLSASSDSGK
jgi:hypothetical protein